MVQNLKNDYLVSGPHLKLLTWVLSFMWCVILLKLKQQTTFKNNSFTKIDNIFKFFNLQLKSLNTNKCPNISRINLLALCWNAEFGEGWKAMSFLVIDQKQRILVMDYAWNWLHMKLMAETAPQLTLPTSCLIKTALFPSSNLWIQRQTLGSRMFSNSKWKSVQQIR